MLVAQPSLDDDTPLALGQRADLRALAVVCGAYRSPLPARASLGPIEACLSQQMGFRGQLRPIPAATPPTPQPPASVAQTTSEVARFGPPAQVLLECLLSAMAEGGPQPALTSAEAVERLLGEVFQWDVNEFR